VVGGIGILARNVSSARIWMLEFRLDIVSALCELSFVLGCDLGLGFIVDDQPFVVGLLSGRFLECDEHG
jgi:hypothetical protein